MRESQDRQLGQLEEGGSAGSRGVVEIENDEEVCAQVCARRSAQGQLVDKGICAAGDAEEVSGETLRANSNISNDSDFNLQPEFFPVTKSDSNLIYVKPATDTSNNDI